MWYKDYYIWYNELQHAWHAQWGYHVVHTGTLRGCKCYATRNYYKEA